MSCSTPAFSTVLKGIQCQIGEKWRGCAHMLLGNDSFSVPTQPADSQQDTMAALARQQYDHTHTGAPLSWLGLGSIGQVASSRWIKVSVFGRWIEAVCLFVHHLICQSRKVTLHTYLYISVICRCIFYVFLEWLSDKQSFISSQRFDGWCHESGERPHSFLSVISCLSWGYCSTNCVTVFSSASPSLTSAVPSSTSFTMRRTSRSISAQRCTVKGRSVCCYQSLCICLTPLNCFFSNR